MLSGTSSFPRKRTGHKLTAIPASYKHAPNGHTRLENVKIKEKAEPGTPIASRFSLGSVDKKDTIIKKDWWQNIAAAKVLIISMEYRRFKTYGSSRLNITS